MTQDAEIPLSVYIDGSNLYVVDNFKYLGSTISSNLSLDVEIYARIGKAATVMAKLNKRAWQNINLTMNTRLRVYQACVTSILLYSVKCLIPSFTRCRHVERSLIMSSQLSISITSDFISLLQTSLKQSSGQPVLCVPFQACHRGGLLESFIFPSCICVPTI